MLYSFGRMKIITRGKTKSAVATAAYHSANEFTNEWDGVNHDFSKKQNVGESFIRMPENAPARYTDESIPVAERLSMIWNDVEQFEGSINAQLARQNYLALQKEFTLEQNLECVDRFIKENCTDIGMGASYSVHFKPGNLHVDIMYLMREFDQEGNFKAKSRKEYLCRDKFGNEQYFTAAAYKKAGSEGWEKVYKFRKGNTWKQLTASEAALPEYSGFKRVSKYPVDRKVDINTWNDRDLVARWRKSWEVILNDKFEELGMPQRVDCRSYKEQGNSKIPTIHEGWGINAAERKEFNQEIKNFTKEQQSIYRTACKAIDVTGAQVKDLQEQPQSPDTIEAHKELLRYNEGVINVITESGIFREGLNHRLKARLKDLRAKAAELIEKYWHELKMPKKLNLEPEKLSLDNLISSGTNRTENKQQSGKKGAASSGDDWGNRR